MAAQNLEFTYSLEELMNDIMTLNQNRVKEMNDKDGNTLFDKYAITEDDSDTIVIFINNAVYDLVEITLPLTSTIANAAQTGDPYGVIVKNNSTANPNLKALVTNLFKQVLVANALLQWYEMKGLGDDIKLWTIKLDKLKKEVVQKRVFQLSIRNVS